MPKFIRKVKWVVFILLFVYLKFTRIPSGLPRHVTFENGAILKLVNMQDSGQLTCTAENEFGSDTKSTNVIVKHCKFSLVEKKQISYIVVT